MRRQSASSWDSLERKLPVLIGGLVVVSVLATFAVVRIEVRESAITSAGERLGRIARQLEQLVHTGRQQRHELLQEVAADPAVIARLENADAPAAADALRRLEVRGEERRPVLLLDTRRRVVAATMEPAAGAAANVPLSDHIAYSAIGRDGERSVYWVSVPVVVGGRTLGHVAQQRVLGSPAASRQLQGLIGGIGVTLANAGGGGRVRIDGVALDDVLEGAPLDTPFVRTAASGERYYTYATAIDGSDWLLVAEVPLSVATARATEVTRRLLAVGSVLLLLGGLAAWLVSRSVTAPLRRLAAAADAIAAGDYSRRTGLVRADEIGHLARSFDDMAGYVDATHAQLAHRFEEARRLAGELEAANAQLQRAVSELDTARHLAQEASAAKSEFLATMSHEIRTPINAMLGYTDLLELGVPGPLTEQQRDFMERIRRSGGHLISVVNDVLDFAKIESGQMRVGRDVLHVLPTVNEAVATMQARAAERGVGLRAECREGPAFVGDGQRLQQILLNLLSNALKFTPEGGVVTISCERRSSRAHPPAPGGEAEWACITVSDTGVGIEPDQRERIFEPFVQGSSGYTRLHGGTGLGLAISRSLARMMGGDLTVESEPGRGARFTVWLPAVRHAAAGT